MERISISEIDTVRSKYFQARKPVIIRNLFKGQPIEDLSDLTVARQLLKDHRIEIIENRRGVEWSPLRDFFLVSSI